MPASDDGIGFTVAKITIAKHMCEQSCAFIHPLDEHDVRFPEVMLPAAEESAMILVRSFTLPVWYLIVFLFVILILFASLRVVCVFCFTSIPVERH